jgi:hypothetical protein
MSINKVGSNGPLTSSSQTTVAASAKAANPQIQDSSSKVQDIVVTSQASNSDTKSAKTYESKISGEAMRQALQNSFSSASETLFGSAEFYSLKEKKVQITGQASEKISSHNTSPAGVPYKPEARIPDNTPIFDGDKIDREKVLQSLSQHDQNTKTTEDKDRCGGTAVIASAINNDGDKGLLKLTAAMKKNLTADHLKELSEIEKKIQDKTATHGDLGKLSELIHNGYSVPDPNGGKGIMDGDIHSLYTDAGLTPPKNAGRPQEIFEKGQSWPINLDTDGDGEPNHWIVAGKDDQGRAFFYDPESTPGKTQIHYEGSPEYDNYLHQIIQTKSGFAPITKETADLAREKYDEKMGL